MWAFYAVLRPRCYIQNSIKNPDTVIIEHEEEGGYHAFCPALKGCHSQGETYEEIIKNIEEAIKLYIESLKEHHDPIPSEDVIIKPIHIAA
ncbi:MAG: type II toxin-antitoxin system HicB family antitoxin [Chlamydiae bacterium]|nr:type II toxin-antitoxin system HicB family antitoxin [Chlamydiota bacterium]MBI3277918.1 type II toxin-antitoxin system HicB family antitoxin [Chlamydiota bacterium]